MSFVSIVYRSNKGYGVSGTLLGNCFEMKKIILEKTFESFCRIQYLPFVKTRKRSWRTDESLINNHLTPFFGGEKLSEIDAKDVMLFQNRKLMEGYQPSSVNRMTVLLKYIVNCSMRWGWRERDRDWAEDVSELRNIRARERFLTQAEAIRLFQVLDAHPDRIAACCIQLLLLTGARKSELLLAKWNYLDWNSQTLIVPLSKSGSSRHIFLGQSALKIFKELQRKGNKSFIFCAEGYDHPIKHLQRVWYAVRALAGLSDVRLHDLRHSYASFLVGQGRSLFEVQKLLGHASSKTTLKYAHLANKQLLEAADVVSNAIGKMA
jgi:integrase